jgi:hypothetical protein
MRARLGGIAGGKLAQPLGEFITPLILVEGLRTGQLIRWLSGIVGNDQTVVRLLFRVG